MNSLLFFPDEVNSVDGQSYTINISKLRNHYRYNYFSTFHREVFKKSLKSKYFGQGSIYGVGSGKLELECSSESINVNIVVDRVFKKRPPDILLVGASRPQSLKEVVRASIMLGISELIFFHSDLGEKSYLNSKLLQPDSLFFQSIQSLEQAVDCTAPSIRSVWSLKCAFNSLFACRDNVDAKICAHVNSKDTFSIQHLSGNFERRVFIIGSEKGFSKNEDELLIRFGFKNVSLGQRIMRVGSATNVILSVNSFLRGF